MKKVKFTAIILCLCICFITLASCANVVAAMEYNGETVSVNMYSYWLSQIKSSYVSASSDTDEYWDTKYSNGQTYEEKMREIVDFNVKVNLICQKLFKDMGLTLPEDQVEEMETGLSDLLASYGSKSELNSMLAKYNINYEMLKDIYEIELKTTTVYDALYAENGTRRIDDEKLDEYFTENYARIDMIMIYNSVVYERDENGELIFDDTTNSYKTRELTEDETAAKNALAEDIMTKLDAGEDFDALKEMYNEDPQKKVYTEGYYISSNDLSVYGSEIVLAAQSMEIGDHQKVDDGTIICIMKRKELTEKPYANENYADQFENLLDYCEQYDFNTYMSELMSDVTVYSEEISKISVREAELMSN